MKFNKKTVILSLISFVFMAGALAFFILEYQNPENDFIKERNINEDATQEATVAITLTDAKKILGGSSEVITSSTFIWVSLEGPAQKIIQNNIKGSQIFIRKVPRTKIDLLKTYFEGKKFTLDESNMRSGFSGEAFGYTNGQMVCTVDVQSSDGTEVSQFFDVKVSCGYK